MFYLIIEFEKDTAKKVRKQIIRESGGKFNSHLFGDFTLIEAGADAVAKIMGHKEVVNVEFDGEIHPKAQRSDYSLDVTSVKEHAHLRGFKGDGVKVAVIDTGFTPAHEDLRGKVTKYCRIEGGIIRSEGNPMTCADPMGHGTAVAGTIMMQDNAVGYLGVAPNIELFVVKATEGSTGSMTYSSMAKAIEWAIKAGSDIINISFSQDYHHSVIRAVCEYAYQKNITVVAAAGNEGNDTEFYGEMTADDQVGMWKVYPGVLTIGAVKSGYRGAVVRADYSSKGTGIDFVAPSNISLSSSLGNSIYEVAAGTSFSSPFIAGMVALVRQRFPGITVDRIYDFLKEHSVTIGGGEVEYYGNGMPVLPNFSQRFPEYGDVIEIPIEVEQVAIGYFNGKKITKMQWNGQEVPLQCHNNK